MNTDQSGDDRARTDNPRLAKPVLSQLSYVPEKPRAKSPEPRIWTLDAGHLTLDSKVGVPGFEPGTSALSELRSNQLSYTPFAISEFLRSGCSMSSDREKVSCIDRMNRCPERNPQSCEDLPAPGTRRRTRTIGLTLTSMDSLPD